MGTSTLHEGDEAVNWHLRKLAKGVCHPNPVVLESLLTRFQDITLAK